MLREPRMGDSLWDRMPPLLQGLTVVFFVLFMILPPLAVAIRLMVQ